MQVMSSIHNYLVNGLQLALGVAVEVDDCLAAELLKLDGVIKVETELLSSKVIVTKKVSTKETPND